MMTVLELALRAFVVGFGHGVELAVQAELGRPDAALMRAAQDRRVVAELLQVPAELLPTWEENYKRGLDNGTLEFEQAQGYYRTVLSRPPSPPTGGGS